MSIPLVLLLYIAVAHVLAFAPLPSIDTVSRHTRIDGLSKNRHSIRLAASKNLDSNGKEILFPVIQRIAGVDWLGECRYVSGADLKPANFVLQGGTRYDIDGDSVSLTSFLTFPNGNSRQVIMKGNRGSTALPSIRLNPTSDDDSIYMVLTELPPDTILIHEVEKASGRVIMTASLSLVGKMAVDEIVQISHELGGASAETPIEGHQVLRLTKALINSNSDKDSINAIEDRGFRSATGQ